MFELYAYYACSNLLCLNYMLIMLELYSEVKIYKYSNSYPKFIDIQIKVKTRPLYILVSPPYVARPTEMSIK